MAEGTVTIPISVRFRDVAKAFEKVGRAVRKAGIEFGNAFAEGLRQGGFRVRRRSKVAETRIILGEVEYRRQQQRLRDDIMRSCAGHRRRQARIRR